MNENPIEGLMFTAMDSLKDMIDVNTIIGEPIELKNGFCIVPISKVAFGFAAGGSEFNSETMNAYNRKNEEEDIKFRLPFGGGSGAGVNIVPIGFIVVGADGQNYPKFVPVEHSCTVDKLLDYVPDFIQKATQALENICNKEEKKKERKGNKETESFKLEDFEPKAYTKDDVTLEDDE